jgi:hypothetical protein
VAGRLGAAAAFLLDSTDVVIVPHSTPAEVVRCELCVDAGTALSIAHSRATRDLTPTERQQYLHEPSTTATVPEPPVTPAPTDPPDDWRPTPPASPAPDEICPIDLGPCELSTGEWRAGRLEPPISLHIDEPLTSLGQASYAAVFQGADASQILVAGGGSLAGAGPNVAIALPQTASGVFDYLAGVPWLEVSRPRPTTIAGLPGQFVRLASDRQLASPIFYIQQFSWRWDPAMPTWVAAVDTGTTDLIVIASSPDPVFERRFVAFIQSIEIAGTPQPSGRPAP